MPASLLVERDIPIPMRDEVLLSADLYRPSLGQPQPVLLQRTPYGKGFSQTSFALLAAERGYAVVIQDTRGRWASDGEDYPSVHEIQDGYDTVEWAVHQPWADGQVGMFGCSYVGYTQFAAAASRHPAFKTIIPWQTFCDPYTIIHHGGALALGAGLSWSLLAGAHMAIMCQPIPEAQKAPLWMQFIETFNKLSSRELFRYLPLLDLPLVGRTGLTRFLVDGLRHATRDEYWQQNSCEHENIRVPAFHIGGWYDIFTQDTLKDFSLLRQQGNAPQKLLIGPWTHGSFDSLVGEVDFGLQSSAMILVPELVQLRWFDFWLKNEANGILEEPPIRLYIMGANQWRDEQEWPLARTQYIPYYLHSGGAANSLGGDGSLTPAAPLDEPADAFTYDPRNPVPTRGGGLCCWNSALPPGAFDQRPVEERPDVLIYTTPPLEQDLEVTGPLAVYLWAASSAPDTDFTAKLVDVGPCGYARNVQDGILRLRHRTPGEAPWLNAGEATEFTIELGATSNLFKAGHRLRLEISSSNFPKYDRNLNTGHPVGQDEALVPAHQTVFHDSVHASHIVLPVIPRGS